MAMGAVTESDAKTLQQSRLSVAEAIAKGFAAEGVEAAFVLMGDGNMHMVPHIARQGARMYNVRHENMGLAMADGYYRLTGKVGVCSVTCGPGLAQLGNCLMIASQRRSAIVVLAGDTGSIPQYGGLQEMDQRAFVESTGAIFVPVRVPETVADDVRTAFFRARTEGPVVLSVPMDVQFEQMPESWRYIPSATFISPHGSPPAPQPDLDRVADLIATAHRPVILAGRGVTGAETVNEIERLADQMGALLATTLPAKGMFAGNPFDIGVSGGYASLFGLELLPDSDLILAVGASLSYYTTKDDKLFPKAAVVHLNTDPYALVASRRPPDAIVVGDASSTVKALADALDSRGHSSEGYRSKQVGDRLATDARLVEIQEEPIDVEAGTVDPRQLMVDIDDILPDDCAIVFCGAHSGGFVPRFLSGKRSRRFIQTAETGSIGQAMSTALGMALSNPGRLVVAFEGDAAAMMNIQELDTAARYGAEILIVILNDEALATELHRLTQDPEAYRLSQIECPDFATVAGAFRMGASTVSSNAEARAAFERAMAGPKPHLIDVRISRRVVNWRILGLPRPTGS